MTSLFSSNTELDGLLWGRPLTGETWLIIIAVVIAATIILYRTERGIGAGLRSSLIVVRVAILLLVAAALFEPAVALKETRQQKRPLAVLIDSSESMSVRDQRKRAADIHDAAAALGYVGLSNKDESQKAAAALTTKQRNAIAASSRLDLAKGLLATSAPILKTLNQDLDVRYYTFGETTDMLGAANRNVSEEITSIKAEGSGTSLADAISEVANDHRDNTLAGIVVLTDGIETGTHQPEAAAQDLGIRGIPLYTIPTGIPDPDDVSIRNVIAQDVAFVGDTVPVRVQIRSKGYEKRSADLVVRFDGREVNRDTITLDGGVQFVEAAFNANVRSKRAVTLEVEIEAFGDETTAENNVVSRSVRVINEKINVLCIEGSARWEFRYLRAILKRDPRIKATFIATRAGSNVALQSSDYIARFPEDPEEAFKYDLVILGDVRSDFFNDGEFARLEELVRERGGSLLMLAGPKYSPGSYGGTPVEKMLPVRFTPEARWEEVGKTVYPVLTPEGRSSLVLTLENERAANDRIWSHVSPMLRLPPLLDARPGASVLAELSERGARVGPYPLISWQRYGTGKCMLMATDNLWRLRFRSGDKYHWRVWSQCIQFLTLSRLMGEHKRIRMETDRVTYPIDDQVRIYAEVLDDGYQPVLQQQYDIEIVPVNADDEDGDELKTTVRLRPDSTRPGLYEGYFSPVGVGRFRVQANEDDRDNANTIEFTVADVRPEMANTDMQLERLQRMAELSGGKCLPPSEFGALAASLNRTPHQTVIRREQSLWDNGLFALLLIALTGFEWILRRRRDLL
jgi:hypothetical protein